MTDEAKRVNYRKLFRPLHERGIISGLSFYEELVEDCEDMFGKVYYHHEQYMRLYFNFKDREDEGRAFIDNLTVSKLKDCGLNPFDGELDKGYMLCLLKSTGKFDIKLELPDNYEK